jgi:hypothetical protein
MRARQIGSITAKIGELASPPISWEEQTSSATRFEHLALAASQTDP